MEIILSEKYVRIESTTFRLAPRLECVTTSLEITNSFYEIITTVSIKKENIDNRSFLDSRTFFDIFSKIYLYSYLREVVGEAAMLGINKLSLNINNDFLQSSYLKMIVEEFIGIHFAFEISDMFHGQTINFQAINKLICQPNLSIWLNDFGSGNSNFDTLEKCDFDGIKMSKELFLQLYSQDRKLLTCLLRNLQRKAENVIVEGVDCFEKYVFCKELGLLMQGHFFADFQQAKMFNLSLKNLRFLKERKR